LTAIIDAADEGAGNKIMCPVLALWSGEGGLQHWYKNEGGPLGLWRRWANDVSGGPVSGGHFFPEESPRHTASALLEFMKQSH
jgi:haloacetate dehalogenase